MRHAIYRRLHFWDADSDGRLRTAVETYGADNWPLGACRLSWQSYPTTNRCEAARLVSEDATPQQCQGRWTRYLDPNIRRGSFTEEEDRLLRDAVAVYGNAWHEISPFLSGRTNEQCRERAQEFNTIANVKKKWTEDEDRAILRAAEDAEVIDFAEVTRVLGTGRTEAQVCHATLLSISLLIRSQVRNRYSALMRRVNRIATHNPTATQMLRPILPASPLQPVLQPVAGPSKPAPQPVARPPGTYRPILPAPARPPEVGQIAYPGTPPQACVPPPIAPRVQDPVPPSLQMIDPALWPPQYAGAIQVPVPGPTVPPQPQETGAQSSYQAFPIGGASTYQSQGADSTSSGAQQSRPRPRPRRKRVVETNPAPLDESTSLAPPPGDDQGRDVEAAPPVARRKGKGKVIELPYEADEPEEDTPTQARKMPKRSRDTAADRPASRKKATKNKELLRANELAGDQTVGCASSRCNRDVVNVM